MTPEEHADWKEAHRVFVIALNALNGYLAMTVSEADSRTQLRAARDEIRAFIND